MLRTKIAWLASLIALSFVFAACAGDAPVSRDGGNNIKYDTYKPVDGFSWPDQFQTQKDKGQNQPDQYVWPDTGGFPDTWSWPTDTYSGVPFGCHMDADCFGKKCCPTPWGVKVCADVCTK